MSVSTTTTFLEYLASGGQTIFNFSGLSYLEGEGNTVLHIYVDDVEKFNWVITEGTATDGVATGGTLTFDTPLAGGETVRIQRETPLTQPTLYPDNYNKETSREAMDRTVMQVQEVDAKAGGTSPSPATDVGGLPDWEVGVNYTPFQQVLYKTVAPLQQNVYRCLVAHTSVDFITDLNDGKWEWVYIQIEEGPQGPTGPVGPTGPQGPQGIQGPAGVNGVFSEIASQVEAEAGTNNTKGMTPLRTAQAITDQVPDVPVVQDHETRIGDLETQVGTNTSAIGNHELRIQALENASPYDRYTGSQPLDNNATDVLLQGRDLGPTGQGVPLAVQSSGSHLTRFIIQILREDDTETRFEQKNIALHFINNVWYLGVEQEIILAGELAGVELAIDTVDLGGGIYEGRVKYTSDNMTGANDDARIKWVSVDEIPVGV